MRFSVNLSLVILISVAGCASDGLSGLPGDAVLTQEGNANLSFTASEKGTVFLRDQPSDRIVYQGPIDKGQKLTVVGKANRVTLDGRPLPTTTALRTDATYQVFFKAAEKLQYHPMMNP